MTVSLLTILTSAALSLPPLTTNQKVQLETATDGAVTIDEAALYPLMQNALKWDPAEPPAGQRPSLEAIMASPAEYRGVPFLIEGWMRGPPRKFERFARPGPWAGKLEQWVVSLTDGATARDDQVVVVYLLDPPEYPGLNRPVRMTARFFKIWHSVDMQNNEMPFAAFIGLSTRIGEPVGAAAASGDGASGGESGGMSFFEGAFLGGGESGGGVSNTMMLIVLLVLGALGFSWWRIKQFAGGPRPLPGQLRRMRGGAEDGEDDEPEDEELFDDGPPLPEDPIEALQEMQRRRREKVEEEIEATPELAELRDAVKQEQP